MSVKKIYIEDDSDSKISILSGYDFEIETNQEENYIKIRPNFNGYSLKIGENSILSFDGWKSVEADIEDFIFA